jgi:hypothetical protein
VNIPFRSGAAGLLQSPSIGSKHAATKTGESQVTRFIRNTLTASLVAGMIATAGFAAPAMAGGSISFSFMPTNPSDAQGLQAGLQIYSLFNSLRQGANIKQRGKHNIAGIGQNGAGNQGIIYQEGSNHSATLAQNGNNNTYGIFQFGRGTNVNVVQNGYGGTGTTFAFGW